MSMATESPLLHDGAQCVLSTGNDARRSSITGSTLAGPNGSGQFLCVALSTLTDRTVNFASSASTGGVTGLNRAYGVLQNTPGPGQAADVGIFGISKVVAGSTNFGRGSIIAPSSLFQGTVALLTTTNLQYNPLGIALESPASTGAVITAFINTGMNAGSTT
jgi:hypothetical protein